MSQGLPLDRCLGDLPQLKPFPTRAAFKFIGAGRHRRSVLALELKREAGPLSTFNNMDRSPFSAAFDIWYSDSNVGAPGRCAFV
jgi:hypothetical protein